MLIDWFTVAAQALNFLVLVGLLKHFLFKPVLDAIDTREKKIAAELADAVAKLAEAQREREEYQNKNKALDDERGALLGKATDAAKAEGERLLEDARRSADALRAAQTKALEGDRQKLCSTITGLARDEVFGIARQTLTDLATVPLEERLGEVFTRRLHDLDGTAKAALGLALKSSADPALVRSSFELPPKERATIQNALNETFSADVRVRFEAAPAVVCGIELIAGGQKLGWSIAGYLQALERKVGSLLDAEAT